MPTDEPFIPPKKKPNVLWWIAGGFALLVFIFFLQLFGPNPPIIVSPQTTHIVSPLGPNGLPDYERYLLEEMREGVTPENNAAALIWQALWPGELNPSQYAAVATELGLEKIPSPGESLDYLHGPPNLQAVRNWLHKQGLLPETPGEISPEGNGEELVEQTISKATNRPWTSNDCPPLAAWATKNAESIDMLVEASQRSRCYFPSPTLLNRDRESLIAVLLPGVQSARESGRALATRAMWHLGEDRTDEAWRDLLAAHRIGRLVAQGPFLVEKLVGFAIDGSARDGTIALLDQGRLTPEQSRRIQSDLESLPAFNSVADSLDSMERLAYLDTAILFTAGNNRDMIAFLDMGEDVSLINSVAVDWNVVLRKGNEFYDRYVAAVGLTDWAAREEEISQINNDVNRLAQEFREPIRLAAGIFSPQRRSEIVASMMVSLLLPAVEAASSAQDRANAFFELERLAAAIAVYRVEHGTYPERLDELVPSILPKVPVDLFHATPFFYKRTSDGYLLYTVGANGVDDGGSNQRYPTFEGSSMEQLNAVDVDKLELQIPDGADDFSIRVPTPKWVLPKRTEAGEKP